MRANTMRFRITAFCFCLLPLSAASAQTTPRADYPELAQRGPNLVGYRQIDIVDPHRTDFLHSDLGSGKFNSYDRHLFVTVWYPAAEGDPKTVAHYDRHPGAGPGSPYADSAQFPQTGLAILNATPKKSSAPAPLVILSHGFTNWATYFAPMGERLASRGYVVASIDHDDIPFKQGSNPGIAFVDTASGRARDQRAVARELRKLSADPAFALSGTYDPDNLALIGYSMGGFGLLESAGAGYDPAGPLLKLLPKTTFDGILEDHASPDRANPGESAPIPGLKALVLLAPWGGQPANRAWSAAALASIKTPALMIDGDHDDIAGYQEGVHWIYDNLKSSDRYLLVFENARHNIVGADAPETAFGNFALIEKWDEPVWRKDRLRAIDAHFIVAFLDRYLRNDTTMDSYLNLPTPHSNDGTWTQQRGQSANDPANIYAGHDPASANYWKGFQRRWALGLELQHDKP
jgi:predicted dienelactone hydrolase